MYLNIPVINTITKEKSYREFETKKELILYIKSKQKGVGNYNLENSYGYWNEEAITFQERGYYCTSVEMSRDFKAYWEEQKERSNLYSGVIYQTEKDEFFVTGGYYFYLNFFMINDKVKRKLDFPGIWDSDYHFFLHILLCILTGKHSVILKKRQWGSSLKHAAILLNNTWFGNAQKNKIFAQDKTHVENTWIFLNDARDHINSFCGWKRNFQPDTPLDWEQKWRAKDNTFKGNKSVLKGLSTEKDPSKPVGGGISVLFGEEAGINSSLDITHQYALPAVGLGGLSTGLLSYAGSVGELEKCEPLKKFMFNPDDNGFMSYENEDTESDIKDIGFFAPEWWNYITSDDDGNIINCFDKWGNTDKELAMTYIEKERTKAKRTAPEDYRYYCSQRPLTLEEAFAWRKESVFPTALINRQLMRLENEEGTPVKLTRDVDGFIKYKILKKEEAKVISKFPFPKGAKDKEGDIVVYKFPKEKQEFGIFFGGVDPVVEGKTDTSESLFSIYIYEGVSVKETVSEVEGVRQTKKELEGDRIAAVWTGRFDDINKTNERAEMLIEWYNAFTVCENNVTSFIQHMIRNKKQKYLATKQDLPFLKEIQANRSVYQEYGVKMTTVVKTHILNQMIEYVKEETGSVHKNDGSELRKVFGVERIPDKMLLQEMQAYHDKLNVDRLISFGLVLALVKSREASGLQTKEIIYENNTKPQVVTEVTRSAFRNLNKNSRGNIIKRRSGFRNVR